MRFLLVLLGLSLILLACQHPPQHLMFAVGLVLLILGFWPVSDRARAQVLPAIDIDLERQRSRSRNRF